MKPKLQTATLFVASFIAFQFLSCSKDANTASKINAATTDNITATSLQNRLVAWYTFNGNTKDHSGNGNNVVFNSATPTTGKNGKLNNAYYFDGISSYMSITNSSTLNPPTSITLAAVIKPEGFYQGNCHANYVLSKQYIDYTNGRYVLGFGDQAFYNYNGCFDSVASHHENFFGTYGDGTAASGTTDLNHNIQLNKWYTLVYTFNGSTSKLYINNVLVSQSATPTTFNPNDAPVLIGRNSDDGNPYYFTGVVDEVRIYNAALTIQQIESLTKLMSN